MQQPITKSSLSDPERGLIELLQHLNFGRVEGLRVRGGAPVLEPSPRIFRTLKMGGQNGPRDESDLQDFWLKRPVLDLLQTIREIGDGEILTITVAHGLPHLLEHRLDTLGGGGRG